ncbi:MAG: PKD domain-containing protein [Candidatus Acetothermia bacterium]|nr:PKD domain-containing protein [Candidatus Acetothermia bacterium]MDH7505295.1 PKD domain-containing protein [Candidatus Acetothermia bacterium]
MGSKVVGASRGGFALRAATIILLLGGAVHGSSPHLLAAGPRDVVINEVAWMGTAASTYDEWIELYNNTDHDIDLTGWELEAADGTPSITLSGIIPAKGYFLLERTDDNTVSDISADQIYGNDGTTWALKNDGEALFLRDSFDNVIDTANGDGGKWPAGTAAGGTPPYATMERIDPLAPDSDSNWATNDGVHRNGHDAKGDPINGTPKALNSASIVNHPPTCSDVSITIDEDSSVEIDLALHCADPDGDPLSGSFVSDPAHGTARFLSPTIRYTPEENFSGGDSFTFRVSDGRLESNTASANIFVNEVNDDPIADAGPDQTVDVGSIVQLDGSASADPDGDELSYTWSLVSRPAGSAAVLSDPAIVDPTFIADLAGVYIAALTVEDGRGGRASDQVTITALANEPPAADFSYSPELPTTCEVVQFVDSSQDPDGTIAAWEWDFGDGADSTDQSPPHRYLEPGAYTVTLTVTDDRGATGTASEGIEVWLREGDADNDCQRTVKDAILAAKSALGLLALTEYQEKAADVVPPCGTIDVRDVVRIAEVALGIKDESIFTCDGGQGLGSVSLRKPQSLGPAELRIGTRELLPGERATLTIFSSAALLGLQAGPEGGLSFDPKVIQIRAVRGVPPYEVLASEVDNGAGRAKFIAIALGEPEGGELVELEVEAIGREGESTLIGLTPDMAIDAEGNGLRLEAVAARLTVGRPGPLKVERVRAFPNPARSREVRFIAEGQGIKEVEVRVYDLSGREVFNSGWVAGPTFEWNLMGNRGRLVASGVYLYILAIRGFGRDELVQSGLKKLVILR